MTLLPERKILPTNADIQGRAVTVLSEAIERDRVGLSEKQKLMAATIRKRMEFATGTELAGWDRYAQRLLEAAADGEPIGSMIEDGYWQVLFLRNERAQRNGPPESSEDWARMVVFEDADQIRRRANGERG